MVDAAGRAQRGVLLQVADGQARMLLGHLLDEGSQVGVGVRAEDKDLKFGIAIRLSS